MGNKNRKNNNGKLETSGNNDNTGIKLASAINDIVSGFSALLLGDPTQPLNAVKKGADDHLFGMISDIRDKLNGKQDTKSSSAPSNSKGVEYSPSWLAELFDSLSSVDKETVKKLQIVEQALAPDGAIVGIVNNLVSLEPQLQILSEKNISIVDLFENTLEPLLKFNEAFAKASGENDIIFGVIDGLATELSSMKQVLDIFANLEIPNNIDEEDIDKIVDIIKGGIRVIDAITKTDDGKPRNLSEQLKDIDKSEPQLEKLVTFVRSFNMIMTALSKTEGVSEEVVESAVGKMDAVVRFINKLSEIDSQALYNLNSIIDSVEKIEQCIIGMGAIMLLASFVGSYIDLGSIVKFAINFTVFVTLCYGAWMFINGIMSIFSSLGGKKKKEDDNTKKALHRFGVDDYATDSGFDALDAFNRIVVTSALVMLFASFVGKFLKIDKILEFTTLLGAFMLLVVTPYMVLMPRIKDVQGVAAELSLLVLVSVGIMLIGAMLVINFPQLILGSLMFGLVLGTFIFLITAAYRVGGGGTESALDGKDKTIKKADGLANVVMKSALALILGPLAIRWAKLEYWKDIIPFAVVLGLFIAAINLSLSFMNPKALRSAGQLSLLVVICASALTLGPILLKKANVELKEVLFFGLIVTGFIFLMILATHLLSKNIKNVGLGILAMIGLAITLAAFVYITKMIGDIDREYGWLEILEGFGKVLSIFTIFGLIAGLLGAADFVYLPVLIGAGVLTALSISISILCDTAKKIFETSKLLEGKELNMKPFIDLGEGLIELVENTWELVLYSPAILAITGSMIMMSGALYTIADVVYYFASSKVPVYDKNGKVAGYRQLNDHDFDIAAQGITKLLTFFTDLISKVWDENKESGLFDTGGGLFAQITGQTKFSQIARSFTSIATVISNISQAIIDMSSARIPVYNGKSSEPTGYRNINDDDFKNAAKNVSLIITTLGMTLMGLYDGQNRISVGDIQIDLPGMSKELAKEMFSVSGDVASWFTGETKFGRVLQSVSQLGNLISSISVGIKDISHLTLPIYKNGKKVGERSLNADDFKNAATNVATVISILGMTIMSLAEGKSIVSGKIEGKDVTIDLGGGIDKDLAEEMFSISGDVASWFSGETKFGRIVGSVTQLSTVISNISTAIKEMSSLTMPIFDEAGNKIGERPLNADDFKNAATNIAAVISILGMTIMALGGGISSITLPINGQDTTINLSSAINKDLAQEMFAVADGGTAWITGKTKFARIVESVEGLGNVISSIAEGISKMAKLEFPNMENGVPTGTPKTLEVSDFVNAARNISAVILTMALTFQAIATGKQAKLNINGQEVTIEGNEQIKALFDEDDDILGIIASCAAGGPFGFILGKTLGITKKESPFARILRILSPLGAFISSMADSILKFATMQIPELNSEGKPTGAYLDVIKGDTLTKVQENMSTVMTGLITAFSEAVGSLDQEKLENIFEKDAIKNLTECLGNITKMLADNVNVLYYYSENKFPYTDENGKQHLIMFTETRQKQADKTIYAVLTTIALSVSKSIESIKNNDVTKNLLTEDGSKEINNFLTTISNIPSTLSNIVGNISKLINSDLMKKFSETDTNTQSSQMSKTLDDVKNFYETIIRKLYQLTQIKIGTDDFEQVTFAKFGESMTEFLNTISNLNSQITQVNTVTSDLINTLAALNNDVILKTINDSTLSEYKNSDVFMSRLMTISTIFSNLKLLIGHIIVSSTQFTKIFKEGSINDYGFTDFLFSSPLTTMGTALNDMSNMSKNLTNGIHDKINNENIMSYKEFDDVIKEIQKIQDKISKMTMTVGFISASIYKAFGNIKLVNPLNVKCVMLNISDILGILLDKRYAISKVNEMELRLLDIKINLVHNILSAYTEMLDFNTKGILINTKVIISSLESFIDFVKSTSDDTTYFESFDENTDIIDRYVKTINSIDVVKIKSFTDSIKAMNELSSKLGSLDKLSEAISKKLAMAIAYLATKLDESGTQIRMASTIHTQRAKTISSAIDKITKIMSSHFIVDVYNASPTNPGNPTVKPESLGNGELTETDLGNRSDVETLDWGTDDISGLSNLKKNMTIGEIRELIKKNTKFNQKEIQLIEKALSRYYTTF